MNAMDDDAILVANIWRSMGHEARPYVRGIIDELDSLGMPQPTKKMSYIWVQN